MNGTRVQHPPRETPPTYAACRDRHDGAEPLLPQWVIDCIERRTNLCEGVNRELKRRTRVVSVFPNGRSCERLVTAVLMEISEDWETGTRYLTMPESPRAGCGSTPVEGKEPKR